MLDHKVVSREKWLAARKELLAKEKEFTRLRDELSRKQRELPWEKVEKEYTFEGPAGKVGLAGLFEGKSQLVVYHFMLGPDWDEGCKSCSFLADHFNPSETHLKQRDVTLMMISRAPMAQIEAFKKRMGWNIKWVSAFESDFNFDYNISFVHKEGEQEPVYYNYGMETFPSTEGPGLSVFYKNEDGEIFHTYSTFSRGLDAFIGAYRVLDIVPKGRDEAELTYGMQWVRHHDRYDDPTFVDPYLQLITISGKKEK